MSADDPAPKSLDICPDFGCAYAWDEEGTATGITHYWPDIAELADLEESLIAWSETYERKQQGITKVLEVYDPDDEAGHRARGRTLAAALARLLAPKGVSVTFCGEPVHERNGDGREGGGQTK